MCRTMRYAKLRLTVRAFLNSLFSRPYTRCRRIHSAFFELRDAKFSQRVEATTRPVSLMETFRRETSAHNCLSPRSERTLFALQTSALFRQASRLVTHTPRSSAQEAHVRRSALSRFRSHNASSFISERVVRSNVGEIASIVNTVRAHLA
jgi:3-oxoacyl-[acyl-carrier-protein] synthase III